MDALKYDSKGLLTAVVQDIDKGNILMVAMMNAQALEMTLETKKAHFWSRSRQKLWLKGTGITLCSLVLLQPMTQ